MRATWFPGGNALRTLAFGLALGGGLSAPGLAAAEPFPEPRPTTPAEAIELLCPEPESRGACVQASLGSFRPSAVGYAAGVRRASELLFSGDLSPTGAGSSGPGGIVIRYAAGDAPHPAIGADQDGAAGTFDPVEVTREGLEQARALVVGQLELPRPRIAEVVITELGDGVNGFFVPAPGRSKPGTIILDATPAGGPDDLRRAAIRQYAYASAVGLNYGLPPGWAEAFATWATITLHGLNPDDVPVLSERLRELDAGLFAPAPELAAGNALWFAFLEQAYGRSVVRLTVEELSGAQPVALALDRALRRGSRDDLASAFAEFHLWSIMTGERSDGQHFTFAGQLESPRFVTVARGLPALSFHRETAVDTFGAAQILLLPQESRGGMRLQFEGDLAASWAVDLLLVNDRGAKHLVPVTVTPERRGQLIVPLDHLDEAWLLVRNLGSEDGAAHRYTYLANYESGFPFELTELRARPYADSAAGVVVAWDTAVEQDLVGFNVLRRVEDGAMERTVNPVWIPALGGFADETSYRYVDRTAEPGVGYVYRIQGITTTGLSSFSESIHVTPAKQSD